MLKQITQSSTLPVTLTEAKTHLRIDGTGDDTYLTALLTAATALVEGETNCDVRTTTWEYQDYNFPCSNFVLPRGPLVSIASIKYYSDATTLTTLATTDYYVTIPAKTLGTVVPNLYWPTPYYTRPDAVQVQFTTGTPVSAMAKHAILLAVATWYENRESETEANLKTLGLGFDRLLAQITFEGV